MRTDTQFPSTRNGISPLAGRSVLARSKLALKGSKSIRKTVRARAATPPTPGEVLREFLISDDRITQDVLAESMGVSRITVNQLVNDRQAVTAEMALRLAKALGTTPNLWLTLQLKVDLAAARRSLGRTLDTIKPLRPPSESEAKLLELVG